MAKLHANKKPVRSKPDGRVRVGTCSNCKSKKTKVIKVKGCLVCLAKCLGGVTYEAPETAEQGILQTLKDGLLGNV